MRLRNSPVGKGEGNDGNAPSVTAKKLNEGHRPENATWTAWLMMAAIVIGLALCVPMKYGRRNIRRIARVEARKKKIADIV